MSTQLSDASVIVNNEVQPIIPNSVVFTEGLGESIQRPVSVGGGDIELVCSEDVSTKFSTVSFDVPTTVKTVKDARDWKLRGNGNVVQVIGETPDGRITRTFAQASFNTNYDVNIATEGVISVEFGSKQAT